MSLGAPPAIAARRPGAGVARGSAVCASSASRQGPSAHTVPAEHRGLLCSTAARPFPPGSAGRGPAEHVLGVCGAAVPCCGLQGGRAAASARRPLRSAGHAQTLLAVSHSTLVSLSQRQIRSGSPGAPPRRRRASRGPPRARALTAGARACARRPAAGQVRRRAAGAARRGRDAAHADRGRAVRAPGAVGRGARRRPGPPAAALAAWRRRAQRTGRRLGLAPVRLQPWGRAACRRSWLLDHQTA
jgi:hypothetical protein